MNFTLIDVGGLLLAVAAGLVVLVAPGLALARLVGLGRDRNSPGLPTGVVAGFAILPALDSIVARFAGLDAALAVTIVLAIGAIVWLVRDRPTWRLLPPGLLLVLAWLFLVCLETVDLDIAGKLYQPLSVFDMVKHAATTQAIYDSGAPPRDAFFLRPERASYYYFFYTLGALMMRLTGGLLSAKAAFAGLVFWTGIGAYGLVRFAMARAGFGGTLRPSQRPLLIVAVMAAGGLDILAVLYFAWSRRYWVADPLQWNEQAGAWLEDVLWVPHHVAALIAGMAALAALCDAMSSQRMSRRTTALTSIGFAGLGFASCLGLSIWVTFGFAATMAAWMVLLAAERRWQAVAILAASGLVALLAGSPQLVDLAAGRAGDGTFPVLPVIRAFAPVELLLPEIWQPLANALALPLNYAVEFGVLALGAFVFWRHRLRDAEGDAASPNEFHRALTIAAICGLVLGALLRSTLFNNDLGWRILLLPLLAGTIWTVVAIERLLERAASPKPALRTAFATLVVAGWATVAYGAVLMRTYPFVVVNPKARFIAANPAEERALRVAYGWANAHLPKSAVLQQNPTFTRAFAFGMYGSHPVGIADTFASLYGADPKAVAARLDSIGPIFKDRLPVSEIAARAAASGISDLVVTAADPVWSQPGSFVWRVKPVFSAPLVRIIPVNVLAAAR